MCGIGLLKYTNKIMTFDELYNKYLINSSVSYDQARFIWNASLDEVILTSEIYKIPHTLPDFFNSTEKNNE
jgi:hypothetical protein